MKADQPINPTIWDSKHNPSFERDNDGLDLRTHMAIEFTKSILGTCRAEDHITKEVANVIISEALMVTDALIEALNK